LLQKRTLTVLAVAAFAGAALPFGLPNTAAAAPLVAIGSLTFVPLPIEVAGTLPAGNSVTFCVQAQAGGVHTPGNVFLSINSGQFTAPPAPGGSAKVSGTPLTVNPASFATSPTCTWSNAEGTNTVADAVPVVYTAPLTIPVNGRDTIVAATLASDVTITPPSGGTAAFGTCTSGVCNTGAYVFSPVTQYVFSTGVTIAATGTLAPSHQTNLTVTAEDSTGNGVPGSFLDLSLSSSQSGGGSATAINILNGNSNSKPVTAFPTGGRFGSDANGSVAIVYSTPATLPASGTDTLTAQNHPTETVEASTTYTFATSTAPTPEPYSALTPTFRVCDTRPAGPGIAANPCNTGAGSGPIGQLSTRVITVAGVGGVPSSGVTAVVVNLTAISPSNNTFLTVYPDGVSRPGTSNLNPAAGATVANLVEVAVAGGKIDLFNDVGVINVAVDIEGYVASSSTALFTPATSPLRICDTRAAGSGIPANRCNTSGASPLNAGTTRTFNVSGLGSPVPGTGVTAVVFNLTAINPTVGTVLTAFAGGTARPTASNLNINAHVALPNRVMVPVTCAAGNCSVSIWNSVGSVNIAVDIDGWFSASGAQFTALTPPARVCNTINGNPFDGGANGGCLKAVVGSGHTLNINVAGIDGVPVQTGHPGSPVAIVANVTAVTPTSSTFITVFPGPLGTTILPNASDLNAAKGSVATNLVVVAVGSDGTISLFNDLGNVNLIVDILGYYS
jgi:hypothetical protein